MTASLSLLPTELIIDIITWLDPKSLAQASQTCRQLAALCNDDKLWQCHIQRLVPYKLPERPGSRANVDKLVSCKLIRPGDVPSWRQVWSGFHHVWFLVKQRFWISDRYPNGKLVMVLFDARALQIVGYDLSAQDNFGIPRAFSRLAQDPTVSIITFDPLLTRQRALFTVTHPGPIDGSKESEDGSSYGYSDDLLPPEIRDELKLGVTGNTNMTKLMLARDLPTSAYDQRTAVWPPVCLPSRGRARNPNATPTYSLVDYAATGYKPATMAEVSRSAVRLVSSPQSISIGNGRFVGISHTAQETLGVIDESVLYPSPDKPLQGIWIGDYSFHGNEFILFMQPDAHDSSNLDISHEALEVVEDIVGELRDTYQDDNQDVQVETGMTGALIAIKLTGDRNVPRAAQSFVVPDLSQALQPIGEREFKDATIVPAAAHLADDNFTDDRYSPAQMIILSNDRVAFYWMELNIITYFCRAQFTAFDNAFPPLHIPQ